MYCILVLLNSVLFFCWFFVLFCFVVGFSLVCFEIVFIFYLTLFNKLVLHDWYNKGCGIWYPVCEGGAYKRTLAANRKQ